MFRRIVSAALAVALLWGGLTPVWAEMSFPDSDTETSASEEFPTLSLGDRDDPESAANVTSLQSRLIELGFLSDDEADGAFGQNTENAVKYFQRLNGLEATGVADRATQELLYSEESALTTPPPIALALESEEVRIQTVLSQWGFLYGKIENSAMPARRALHISSNTSRTTGFCPSPRSRPRPRRFRPPRRASCRWLRTCRKPRSNPRLPRSPQTERWTIC